jgi:hypothetical protein
MENRSSLVSLLPGDWKFPIWNGRFLEATNAQTYRRLTVGRNGHRTRGVGMAPRATASHGKRSLIDGFNAKDIESR